MSIRIFAINITSSRGFITLSADLRVNSTSVGLQAAPTFVELLDGGLIQVWEGSGPNGTTSLFAQRFDSLADPVGVELQLGTEKERDQRMPAAAVLGDTGFVVAWEDGNQSDGQTAIRVQAYDLSGAAIGGEILVTAQDSGLRTDPSIASMLDGGFVVTWQSFGQGGSGWGVFARRRITRRQLAELAGA